MSATTSSVSQFGCLSFQGRVLAGIVVPTDDAGDAYATPLWSFCFLHVRTEAAEAVAGPELVSESSMTAVGAFITMHEISSLTSRCV